MNCWIKFVAVILIVTLCGAVFPAEPNASAEVAAKIEKNKVTVTIDGKLFTCYKFAAMQKYPYFWPVNGPASGKSITTETSQPYPHHHSLFFGCDRVNGGNYWQEGNERGQIVSQGPKLIMASGDRVIFTDKCLWRQPGKEPIILDRRRVVITAPNETLRLIDFEISLDALTNIRILKSNHALFSARVVPELSVKSGGTLINAEGKTGEKETWGVPSPWCDYSGTRDGITEGIAILQHPHNRWFPAKWFTRDYGFFSPTPMNWLKDGRMEMAKGETLTLRYRVAVHTGDVKTAGIKVIFEQYKRTEVNVKVNHGRTPVQLKMEKGHEQVANLLSQHGPKAPELPESVDLRPDFERLELKPRKQGNRETCSVFATTWALEFALSKQLNKAAPLSVEYLNWACNKVINNRTADRGQFFHHLLKGFEQYGICYELDMPYADRFNPQYSPSVKALEQAKKIQASGIKIHWVNPWKQQAGLTDVQIRQIKKILAQGWPVAAGSTHSRLLVGYRNDTRQPGGGMFITKDSGPGTYTEVTYEFVKKEVRDVFWVESQPKPVRKKR